MLITQLDATTSKIKEIHGLEEAASDAQAYATRAKQLQTPAADLAALALLANEFRCRGIAIPLNAAKFTALAYQARTAHERFLQARESILEGTSELAARFFEPLKNATSEVRRELQQAWTSYVDTTLPSQLQPDLLNLLGRLPGFTERISSIVTLYREAAQLRERLPEKPAETDRIEAIAAELRSAWTALPTTGMPSDVREFLEAVVDDGAALSQLTASVVEWLRVNNLNDNFRIALRATKP